LRTGADAERHKYTAERIKFANALRGIAALIVVFCHYVPVFNAIRGGYKSFPLLPEPPFPLAAEVFTTWPISLLQLRPSSRIILACEIT
jgi:hypothetical protein